MEKVVIDGAVSADDFLKSLLGEGSCVRCDESNDSFNKHRDLPTFYDEEQFRRGQRFFHRNIFAMFFTKVLGLVTILSIPDLVQLLKFTQMSDKPMTAYRRYLTTVFHMCVWYDSDFTPDSKLWQSIEDVRRKHNTASQRNCCAGQTGISQKNMALTQFGFMGYAIARTKDMGIHDAERKDLEAFIHVWRVIGYLMGIEDRFNVCRGSLEETREICNILIDRVFKPEVEKNHADYVHMASALLDGMWCMMPAFNTKVFLQFIFLTVCASSNNNNNNNNNKLADSGLNMFERLYVEVIRFTMYTLKYSICRLFHNYNFYLCLWFMNNWPFLAYYRFGKSNSHVTIVREKVL